MRPLNLIRAGLAYWRIRAGMMKRRLRGLEEPVYLDRFLPFRAFSGEFSFIQIGAYDGWDETFERASRHGWSGIVVEPQPIAFSALKTRYQNNPLIHCENVAIAPSRGERTFYWIDGEPAQGEPEWLPMLASLDYETLIKHQTQYPGLMSRVRSSLVECVTFADLADKHGLSPIDYVQIDAEGMDFEIIKSIDFSRWTPLIIRFEHIHLSAAALAECARLLHGHHYELWPESQDTIALLTSRLP